MPVIDKEEWKNIQGYDGYYEISNHGRVKSLHGRKPRILSPGITSKYVSVCLSIGDLKKMHRVHRLVAEAFIPNPESKPEVNHGDGIKTNNHWKNLAWSTKSENTLHAYEVLGRVGPNKGKCGAANGKSRYYVVTHPCGKQEEVKGLMQFCKQHKLDYSSLYKVIRGDLKHHKGFTARFGALNAN